MSPCQLHIMYGEIRCAKLATAERLQDLSGYRYQRRYTFIFVYTISLIQDYRKIYLDISSSQKLAYDITHLCVCVWGGGANIIIIVARDMICLGT